MTASSPPTLEHFRADIESARSLVARLYSDDEVRRECLQQLANSIQQANTVSPSGWGVTLHGSEIRLNVGFVEALVMTKNTLALSVERPDDEHTWSSVIELPGLTLKWNGEPFKSLDNAYGVILPADHLGTLLPVVRPLHEGLVQAAAARVRTLTNFHKSHSPGVIEFLRQEIAPGLPDPAYDMTPTADQIHSTNSRAQSGQVGMLRASLLLAGLHFSTEIVSNYLLALQTKRFVILTGISGTGKTQLALAVANHFRQSVSVPHAAELPQGAVEFTVKPYTVNYGHMVLPTTFTANLINPPRGRHEGSRQILVEYPAGKQLLTLSKDADRNVTNLFLSGALKRWFLERLDVGDQFAIELLPSEDGTSESLRIHVPAIVQETRLLENYVVSAVRPDWTDNRGLLGYFNPLIGSYVMTPFLRFLLEARDEVARARQEKREPVPFFAILDEMNLARVEHYFSDFLSALESGEPIHLHDHIGIEEGETEDAVAVPRQLRIPENVYFTGTVNVDETTYMFSPKVLDRAFTIELNRVDLEAFGSESSATGNEDDAFALSRFSGALGPSPKPSVADWAAFGALLNGQLRQVVTDLHHLLAEEDRHFGYRVANEIARFVNLASDQTDGTDEELWVALDLAILQKVLSKFHGTQQELETVLTRLMTFVEPLALPRTEAKLRSMQRRLGRQGFTSFIE